MVDGPQIVPPPHARFFKVERLDAGKWLELRAGRRKFHAVGDVDPLPMAQSFGPGTYRIVFTGEDRRNSQAPSDPFQVVEPAPDGTPPARELNPPKRADEHPVSADEQPDPPPPNAEGTADPPPPRHRPPKKPKARKADRREHDMPSMDPAVLVPPAGAVLHPLGQFAYLESMSSAKADKFQTLLVQGMQMMIANERARSEEHIAQVRAHYEALDKSREQFMALVLSLTAKPNGELAQVREAIGKLSEQVEELADDEDDPPELDPVKLAQLSESPNDLERALAAVQNVIGVVANSPIGTALAERLKEAGPLPEPK